MTDDTLVSAKLARILVVSPSLRFLGCGLGGGLRGLGRMNRQSVRCLLPALAVIFLVFVFARPLEAEPNDAGKSSEPLLFSFVQMCDTQLGMGGYEHDVKTFGLAVDQINQMKPDFVVICGDLVQKANEQSWIDFHRIKAGFKIPCYCAAGNHDVENVPTAESLRRYREKVGKD